MKNVFPFYSSLPGVAEIGIFHTHPRCRVGQRIALSCRMAGTGEGRQECPFCFLLGQFQANRALRGKSSGGGSNDNQPGQGPGGGSDRVVIRPLRSPPR